MISPSRPSVTQPSAPPYLPTPDEIEAIIEEARRHARRRRRRSAAAAAVLALVGVGIALAGSGGGAARQKPRVEPSPPARQPVITPVRLSMHNGPLGVFGYVGGVREISKRGRLRAFTVRCTDCRMVKGADWSGDGKLLVYSASCAFGGCGSSWAEPSHGIRVLNPRTGIDRRLVHGDSLGPLSVTADGSWIVYADGHELRTVPVDGSKRPTTILTNPSGWFRGRPTWSPDGRWIAYTLDGWVFTVAADGSDRALLAHAKVAAWSPDGRWIAYEWGGDIRLITPNGTRDHIIARPRVLVCHQCHEDIVGFDHEDIEWSPDGHRLALMVDDSVAVVSLRTGSVRRPARLSSSDSFMFTSGLTWRPIP